MIEKEWKFILMKSYTAWVLYALLAVTIAPDIIYISTGIDTDPAVWSFLQTWVIILGLIGRLLMQPSEGAIKRRIVIGILILLTVFLAGRSMAQTTERETMAVLTPLVLKWEGEHRCPDDANMHCAYIDIVGVPTICFGETRGVRAGDRASDTECLKMLRDRLTNDFRRGLHGYFTVETITGRLTPERDAAYVSLAYNVGIRGAGRSTATRRLNSGNIEGGCQAIGWWNKAGGRVVRGLANRRSDETRLCLTGL